MNSELKSEMEFLNDRKMWEASGQRRELFGKIEKDISSGMMVMVPGLRRTGKTYLVQQILSLREKPFYFSFDKLSFQKPAVLEEVIRHAISQGFKTIALDEVQKVQGWAGILKGYYDHYKPKPSFLLSGSSAIHLRKGSESLSGRIYEHQLAPLNYSEFLEFREIDQKFRQNYVEDYLRTGAFPEVVLKGLEPARYARSVVDKIIGEDIPQLYSLDNPGHLSDIVGMLAERMGQQVDWRDVGASIGIGKDTAQRYSRMLEGSFLFDIVRMRGKYGATVGKSKKVYFAHPSIAAAYADVPEGLRLEAAVYLHLKPLGSVGFFRDGPKEIDFTLERKGKALAIEVKYRNSISASDHRALRSYMESKGVDGVLLTKNDAEEIPVGRNTLYLVPVHEFLYSPPSIVGKKMIF